ncbi:MAG: NAD-dependent epimerase/dehydratase family protein, partial [Acidimicrobiia bacterium]
MPKAQISRQCVLNLTRRFAVNVLVTGSHGFIAGALIPRLRADGHRVVRLVRGNAEGLDDVRWDP